MEITKVYSAYFSPTGGTEKVTSLLAGAFGKPVETIDLTENQDWGAYNLEFLRHEFLVAGVPSYGGRVPAAAVERLSRLHGHGTPVLLLTVYGNRAYDDTLLELRDVLKQRGFVPIGAIGAVAEHSIMHEFGAGRPDEPDQKELLEFAARVKEKLASMREMETEEELKVPGNMPYREYGGVPMKPEAGRDCVRCGICAKLCPVGAIPADRPAETDKDKCISCMRCIKVCPEKARSVNKLILWAATKKMAKACAGRKGNDLFL